jgi:tRNA pseudouridine13 synthase
VAMLLSEELPGTGGILRVVPEDFVVEEIPAYEPSGTGDHIFITIEKRGLSTQDAIRAIARALDVRDGDIGSAGLKDRQALTRQALSIPGRGVDGATLLALELPGIKVLSAARHGNKLKTGHLRGNRFILTIRGLAVPEDEAVRRAEAIFGALSRPPGVPNWYGEQRFAPGNVERGRALVRGEPCRPAPRDLREKRFLVSAFQSALFNQYLEKRMKDGLYAKVITGDILRKVETGGIFATADPAVDQPRLDAGEIAPTGPMFGHDMRAPAAGTDAAGREEAVLAGEGLQPSDFLRVSRIAEGTRRPIGISLGEPRVRAAGDAIEICFNLPAGSYATVVASEVIKS